MSRHILRIIEVEGGKLISTNRRQTGGRFISAVDGDRSEKKERSIESLSVVSSVDP
jgi:hypothetical protein